MFEHDCNVRADHWNYKRVGLLHRLREQTLGLPGFGRIGQRTARKMREIIPAILAYDPYQPPEVFEAAGTRPALLEEVLRSADVICIHAPSIAGTYHPAHRYRRQVRPDALERAGPDAL